MRGSQCLFNSATALRQIFISNALASDASSRLVLLPAVAPPLRPSASVPSRRPFSTQPAAQQRSRNNRLDTSAAKAKVDNTMRDYDIIYPWVQVRQEDGKLAEPQRTNLLLKKLNNEKYSLVLVAPPRKDGESKGPEYPIVRLVDKKAEYAAASAAKVAGEKKGPKVVSKEVELNWAIAPHDLDTRMGRLVKFLEKGYRVQLTIANPKKKAKRRATDDEAKGVYKRVKQTVEEAVGTVEYKPQEGVVKETVVMYLQGSGKRVAESPPVLVERKAAEKEAVKEQEGEEPGTT